MLDAFEPFPPRISAACEATGKREDLFIRVGGPALLDSER